MRRFAATIRGQGVDPDYQAVLDFAVSQGITLPNGTQQNIDNQLLIDYKSEGLWNLDDVFFKFKGDYSDNSFRLIDWKRLILADDFGAVGYSNQGIAGNKTNAYIDTKYNPNIDGVKFTLNDNAITHFEFNYQLDSQPKYIYGCYNELPIEIQTALINNRVGGTNANIYASNGYVLILNALGRNGINILNRTSNTIVNYVSNVVNEVNHNSIAIPSENMYLLCRSKDGVPNNYSKGTMSYFTMGASRLNKVTEIENILI